MKYFGPFQRMLMVGPVVLLMYWFYSLVFSIKNEIRYIFVIPFLLTNVLFNVTIGSFIFWSLPREFFFTDRLKKMKQSTDTDKRQVAFELCREMNKADPGHC